VKVLLTVYARCLADQQATYNDRIVGSPGLMTTAAPQSIGGRFQ
jgi:hypothetical protein